VLGETEITGQIKNARRDRASRRTYWSGIELLLSESFISRTTHLVYKRIGVGLNGALRRRGTGDRIQRYLHSYACCSEGAERWAVK
jgi:hypothetical protein